MKCDSKQSDLAVVLLRDFYNELQETPRLIVVPDRLWDRYYGELNGFIRKLYEQKGFYLVTATSMGCSRENTKDGRGGIPAVSFRGCPVVKKTDFFRVKPQRKGVVFV